MAKITFFKKSFLRIIVLFLQFDYFLIFSYVSFQVAFLVVLVSTYSHFLVIYYQKTDVVSEIDNVTLKITDVFNVTSATNDKYLKMIITTNLRK